MFNVITVSVKIEVLDPCFTLWGYIVLNKLDLIVYALPVPLLVALDAVSEDGFLCSQKYAFDFIIVLSHTYI